jgi:hypothetical protein
MLKTNLKSVIVSNKQGKGVTKNLGTNNNLENVISSNNKISEKIRKQFDMKMPSGGASNIGNISNLGKNKSPRNSSHNRAKIEQSSSINNNKFINISSGNHNNLVSQFIPHTKNRHSKNISEIPNSFMITRDLLTVNDSINGVTNTNPHNKEIIEKSKIEEKLMTKTRSHVHFKNSNANNNGNGKNQESLMNNTINNNSFAMNKTINNGFYQNTKNIENQENDHNNESGANFSQTQRQVNSSKNVIPEELVKNGVIDTSSTYRKRGSSFNNKKTEYQQLESSIHLETIGKVQTTTNQMIETNNYYNINSTNANVYPNNSDNSLINNLHIQKLELLRTIEIMKNYISIQSDCLNKTKEKLLKNNEIKEMELRQSKIENEIIKEENLKLKMSLLNVLYMVREHENKEIERNSEVEVNSLLIARVWWHKYYVKMNFLGKAMKQ